MTTTDKKRSYAYNTEETHDMAKDGFITPRQAAELYGVNISMPYRATTPRTVGGKTVPAPVRMRLGGNARNRFIHKGDWVKYMTGKQEDAKRRLGITRAR